jgi:hypothetical protein
MGNDTCSEFSADYTINFTKEDPCDSVPKQSDDGVLVFTWPSLGSLCTKQAPVKISGNSANAFILVNDIDPAC